MHLMDQIVLAGNNATRDDSLYAFSDFVYHHFDEVKDLSIEELARRCALSPATVSRIVGKLGFESYRAFRDQCAVLTRRYHDAERDHDHFRLDPGNVEDTLARTVGPAAARASDEQLDLFLSYLLPEGATCHVVGLANMHILAEWVQCAVASFHNHDVLAPANFRNLSRARHDDTVIVLSATGNAFNDTDLAQILRACPARRLLVTTSNFNCRGLPVHDVIVLRSPTRQHLINNYLMQLFVDMALCRAGLYD